MLKPIINNFSYRVYYEDTDAGGVVYYANYLKFFERARTDFLREKNIVQSELAKNSDIIFVVRNCFIEYLKPAKMDDAIMVFVEIEKIGKASMQIKQEIKIDQTILCKMNVEIACVDAKSFKPKRIPADLQQLLK